MDTDAETSAGPISVPDTGDHGDGGKLKMIVQLVKRALGVKDIAAMCVVARLSTPALTLVRHALRRLSLPASLLEPIPNLEYWNYLGGYASQLTLVECHFIPPHSDPCPGTHAEPLPSSRQT